MARFVNPITDLKPLGSIFFFKSGTNSPLITFADDLESIQNPAQIDVNSDGNLPNVFFSGSARVKYLDEFGQQYNERDPVGGERELGDFTLWDTVVSYDLNDIVEGSDGRFYQSLTNANQANNPTTNADKWKEIRFIGVYNINVTYSAGDVVQTTNGDLWKSLISTNINNDPSTDDGTKWLPAIDGSKVPDVIALEALNMWINNAANFTVISGESYQIDGSGGTVDATLPVSLVAGDVITVHNESISTNKVQLLNSALTIKGPTGTIAAGTDLELDPGDTVKLVAKTTLIVEVV